MKRLLSIFIFAGFSILLLGNIKNAGDFFFSVIDGESGLSQNKVNAIIQDSNGFIWFGASDKLNRYDGVSVQPFDCFDPVTKKRSNGIAVLAEDSCGKLWIGTGVGIFLFDPITEKFSYFNKQTEKGVAIEAWISDIRADKDHNMWIAAPGQGLFRFDTQTNTLHHYTLVDDYFQHRDFAIQCICVEKNGTTWIGTRRKGIFLYNNITDSFTHYSVETKKGATENNSIFSICEYGEFLVIGFHEGRLATFNKHTKELEETYISNGKYDVIRAVQSFDNRHLWIGTQSGLYVVNESERSTIHIEQDMMNRQSLSDNKINCIYGDNANGIWIGTFFGGVNYLPERSVSFEKYIPLSHKNSVSSKRIKELGEDENGNIWIGTEDAGLNIFHPGTKDFKQVNINLKSNITGLFVSKEEAWIGSFSPGLDIVRFPKYQSLHYPGTQIGTNDESIFSFYEDSKGNMWIGTLWSLYVSPKNKMSFREIEALRGNFIFDILEDKEGLLWIVTLGQGVFKYDPLSGDVEHFFNREGDQSSLPSNAVSSITEDSRGRLWFATDGGGICMYDKTAGRFISYGIADGLPDNTAYKILEDANRCLWFGTTKGLVRFDPQTKESRVFTVNDGLPGNRFNYRSALKSRSGKLYFGSLEGLIVFDPCCIEKNQFIPPVFITKMTVSNREITPHSDPDMITQSISNTQKIVLKHNQSTIGFEFAALDYTAPQANNYAYMMENVDKTWIYTNNNHSVSYAKLPPGKYIFRVKGSNNDGIWNEMGTNIRIEILPPWWLSTGAYFLYFVLIIGLGYYCIRHYKQKQEKKIYEKQHLFETQKEKELYRSKIDFFTNVAHEIRTPLTLINSPLEDLLEMNIENERIRKNLTIMEQNTRLLLNQINQLLDFRKVESDTLPMNFTYENISDLLKELIEGFEPFIQREEKVLRMQFPEQTVLGMTDRDALVKILNNLLSNAVKYSDRCIDVELRICDGYVVVVVRNDGELIPENQKEKVFEPFFRMKKDVGKTPGSGIGLAIARSFAERHRGSLSLKIENDNNVFILKLPLDQPEAYLINNRYETCPKTSLNTSGLKDEKLHVQTILFVEDNPEMRSFIAGKLQGDFAVKKASGASEALDILKNTNIDLIITDVMMNETDGFELCRIVKTDIEFSHIPVILLTARTDQASKIQGLEAGADAYMEKPFSFNHLIAQINTLFNNRLRERKVFLQKPFLAMQQQGMNKADEIFLHKVVESIHKNITDYNFGVEKLAEMYAMSRSSLHRKIKALTDLSPTDFIRLIRLQKAAELIRTGEYRIGDIYLLVGFNSWGYFSKMFQKQFGMSPKEFEKQHSTS